MSGGTQSKDFHPATPKVKHRLLPNASNESKEILRGTDKPTPNNQLFKASCCHSSTGLSHVLTPRVAL
eukprot:9502978-Pyramimonas_sp.AAC.1